MSLCIDMCMLRVYVRCVNAIYVYVYIYTYVCVCIYIYIYIIPLGLINPSY